MFINTLFRAAMFYGALIIIAIALSTASVASPFPNLQQKLSQINQKVQSKGSLRVIVGLQDQSISSPSVNFNVDNKTALVSRRTAIATLQEKLATSLPLSAAKNMKRFKNISFIALEVDQHTLNVMRTSPYITSIEEDYIVPPVLSESVPQTGVNNAWKVDYSGKGQVVVVLDTGADSTHPMLANKVVAEACFGTTSALNTSSPFCPNGLDQQIGLGAGINCPASIAQCFHGTHVSGIAVGNSEEEIGVAKDAELISVQVFSEFTDSVSNDFLCESIGLTSPCALSYTSDQMLALEWVFDQRNNFNIAAVNMSLGGGRFISEAQCDANFIALKAAIDNLRSANIATVIAAGNNGFTNALSSPGCISTAISVGAVSGTDGVAGFSNSAPFLDLLAPGVGINSAEPGDIYQFRSGTSMAAPHVAGAWAALKSQIPEFTVDQVFQALTSTGLAVTDGRNSVVTPRIQVDQATKAFTQLQPGMNFFGGGVPGETIGNTFDLLATLGTNLQVDRVTRFDTALQLQPPLTTMFEIARYDESGTIVGDSAPIISGEGYIVYSKEKVIYENDLSTSLCGPIQLWAGFNIANIGCAPVGMSSFDLMTQIGDTLNVASIQSFNEKTGRLLTTTYYNGQPVGEEFAIIPTHSIIINTYNDISLVIQ